MRAVLVLALVLVPTVVLADALPDCAPGTHMVMNPTPPGAMHHGGGFCAPDEPPTNPLPEGVAPTAPAPPEPTPVGPTATPTPTVPAPAAAPATAEGAAPAAAAPAPSSGLCSASPASSSALAAFGLFALFGSVLRRTRMA